MHELGVLAKAVQTVDRIAQENKIKKIKHMTLEVGEESSFVPMFFTKLFPVAIEPYPRLQGAELKIETVPGDGLSIKEIGY
ncbi:MAG: hydrogenase maturation nickel metallochaperone HypA [Ruminococcaceae bacterium]|nr:hydrogenase maturation nickel metallochaperone HypA [Oscillospiraceae bacterium]